MSYALRLGLRLPARRRRRGQAQRAGPGHPHRAGLRRRHRLRAAADRPLPGGAAPARPPWTPCGRAWKGAAPAIIASGGTVIVSLLCLLLSSLNSNRALGPVAAIGIAATLLVMLTFLPALLVLGGRWAFWPRRPHRRPGRPAGRARHLEPRSPAFVARHARPIWLSTAVVLAVLALGLTQLGATTLGQSDLFTQRTDSVAGAGGDRPALPRPAPAARPPSSPPSRPPRQVTQVAQGVPGVADVRPLAAGTADRPTRAERRRRRWSTGGWSWTATLADPPDSDGAEQTLRELREAVHAGARRRTRWSAASPRSTWTPPTPPPATERHHPGGAGGHRGHPGPAAACRCSPRCC